MHRVIDWMHSNTGKLIRGLLPDDQAMCTPSPYTAPKLEINW